MAGRPLKYGKKKTREVSVSEEGWLGILAIASSYDFTSVSEFLEELGRNPGWIKPKINPSGVEELSCNEQVEAAIAYTLPRIVIKDRAIAARSFKKLLIRLAEINPLNLPRP